MPPSRARRSALPTLAAALLLAACAAPTGPTRGLDAVAPRVLLLGEVHDNPDGHARRYAWLEARVDAGWRPTIAMEQFDRDRQADLDRAFDILDEAIAEVERAEGH